MSRVSVLLCSGRNVLIYQDLQPAPQIGPARPNTHIGGIFAISMAVLLQVDPRSNCQTQTQKTNHARSAPLQCQVDGKHSALPFGRPISLLPCWSCPSAKSSKTEWEQNVYGRFVHVCHYIRPIVTTFNKWQLHPINKNYIRQMATVFDQWWLHPTNTDYIIIRPMATIFHNLHSISDKWRKHATHMHLDVAFIENALCC